MIDEAVQVDEEVLSCEVSDEALEAGNEALPAITMFCTGIGAPCWGRGSKQTAACAI